MFPGSSLSSILGDDNSNSLVGTELSNIIYGYGDDDLLDGGFGDDLLIGGTGNDTLIGGDGNDILDGGVGNDTLIGGTGSDVFILNNSDGVDTINGFVVGEDIIGLDLSAFDDELYFRIGGIMHELSTTDNTLSAVSGPVQAEPIAVIENVAGMINAIDINFL